MEDWTSKRGCFLFSLCSLPKSGTRFGTFKYLFVFDSSVSFENVFCSMDDSHSFFDYVLGVSVVDVCVGNRRLSKPSFRTCARTRRRFSATFSSSHSSYLSGPVQWWSSSFIVYFHLVLSIGKKTSRRNSWATSDSNTRREWGHFSQIVSQKGVKHLPLFLPPFLPSSSVSFLSVFIRSIEKDNKQWNLSSLKRDKRGCWPLQYQELDQ